MRYATTSNDQRCREIAKRDINSLLRANAPRDRLEAAWEALKVIVKETTQ